MSVSTIATTYPIQWSEGMLLSPQHLQQSDRYWEQQLCNALSLVQPNYYGVSAIEINESSLNGGRLVITKLEGIMPDGLIISYPNHVTDEGLEIDLAEELKSNPTKNNLSIYLRVPKRGQKAATDNSPQQRFVSIPGTEEYDENTGVDQIQVERLAPKLSLSTREPNTTYTYLKLLEVKLDEDGLFELNNYYPPMLNLRALNTLGDLSLQKRLREMRDTIRHRASKLSRVLKSNGKNTSQSHRSRYSKFVTHLVKALPTLDIFSETTDTHPYTLYTNLAIFLGQIGSINPQGVIPEQLPGYQHNDCYSAFSKVIGSILKVASSVKLAYQSFGFDVDSNNNFYIELQEKWQGRDLYLEVTASNDQTFEDLKKWVNNALIGSVISIPILEQTRTNGAPREQFDSVSAIDLSRGMQSVLIRIGNEKIVFGGKSLDVFEFGERLIVKMNGSQVLPSNITLHVPNAPEADTKNEKDT